MKTFLLVCITIASLASSALAAASSPPAPPPAPDRQTRPNLVFLMADQLRYQSCGFAGDTRVRTPSLDSLTR